MNVAVVVGGILTLSVALAMIAGADMSSEAKRSVALRQDASYALRFTQRRVRGIFSDEIEVNEDGDVLTLYPDAEHPHYFQQDGDDLIYFDGTDTETLVEGKLETVAFELVDGQNGQDVLLSVALALADDGLSVEMPASLTLIRNRPEE